MRKFCVLLAVLIIFFSCGVALASDPGKVTIRTPRTLPSLDWEQTTTTDHMKLWHQMFEGLYGMDEAHGGYYNELAKEVKLSDDQLTYTITLVENVKFQNGEPLKASDVVFSYNRARKNSRFNYLTSMIEDVKALDDGTVQITLNKPYSPIAHTFFCIKIASEKEVAAHGDKYGSVPHKAGTGPYYPIRYDLASGLNLEAFDGYWRGAPAIKKLDYVVIEDASAAVIAFKNGEIITSTTCRCRTGISCRRAPKDTTNCSRATTSSLWASTISRPRTTTSWATKRSARPSCTRSTRRMSTSR